MSDAENKKTKWFSFSGIKNGKKGGKLKKFVILGVLAVAAFAVYKKNTDSKKASVGVSEQKTTTVTKGNLTSELTSSGTISPKDTYSITSLVEGDIIEANFEEGDQVEEGQVLYRIDVSSMESEMRSAENSVGRANNNYEQALKDYNEAVSDYSGNTYKSTRSGFVKELLIEEGDKVSSNMEIATVYNDQTMKIKAPFLSGEAQLIPVGAQAVLTLDDTEEELTGVVTAVSNMDEVLSGGRMVRQVTLEVSNPGGLTSSHTAVVRIGEFTACEQGNFEAITDTKMKAEVTGNGTLKVAKLLVHEGDYIAVGTPIFRIEADDVSDILRDFKDKVDSAEERVESAQSSLDNKQDTYDNYTITAPISGRVIAKNMKAGDTISRGSNSTATTMAVIYDLSEVTFQMSIDELDVRSVKVGQKVQVTADALEGVTMTGHVTNVSLESSQSNGVTNYPVTVTMDEVGELLPGMNVDGVIILDEVQNALMIPVDSLMRGNKVYVKDDTVTQAEGRVPAGFRAVDVQTGLKNDNYVEITEGLTEGEEIYVDASSNSSGDMFFMGGPNGGMGGGPGGGAPGGGAPGGGAPGGGSNRGNRSGGY